MKVVVSILPEVDLVQRLGGARVEVQALVPPGHPPELFEPSPRQLAHLSQSRLYVRAGMPFEPRVLEYTAAQCPQLAVHDLRDGLSLLPLEAHDHALAGEPRGASDPHVWMDPRRMQHAARLLAATLIHLDPAGQQEYERNLAALAERLDEIDAQVREKLAGLAGRRFYVFHPAFGYFADRYGLVQVAVESGGKEPGARQMAQLLAQARADRVTTLFVQPQFSPQTAETVARSMNAKVVVLDDLPADLAANYLDLAGKLSAALRETLP